VKDLIVRGEVYSGKRMISGTYSISKDRFVDSSVRADVKGTLLKGPINFHTHLGDAFIKREPQGDIKQIVGPKGFKMTELQSASIMEIRKYIGKSVDFMKDQGTAAFFDFRESGVLGLKSVPNLKGISGFFMTRPSNKREIEPLLEQSAGFGLSSLSDYDFDFLLDLSVRSHKRKKLFAIHFSEDEREDVKKLAELKPDFIIHCLEASDDDIDFLKQMDVPIVITPRSNLFHGKRPDYSKFFRKGLNVLLGTDNAFITEPGIMDEAAFLYRYQRKLGRLSPEEVLATVTDNPREEISRLGLRMDQETYLLYPDEELTAYQILTRPNFYERVKLTVKDERINFFPRKH
jgi:hypothetical protein